MLRGLTSARAAVHRNDRVVRILCSAGTPQETILAFAFERYPFLVNRGRNITCACCGASLRMHLNPTCILKMQLDWLLDMILPLVRTVRLFREGKREKAMSAFADWNFVW